MSSPRFSLTAPGGAERVGELITPRNPLHVIVIGGCVGGLCLAHGLNETGVRVGAKATVGLSSLLSPQKMLRES
jgi:hypothetical protein